MSTMIRDPWQAMEQWRRDLDRAFSPMRDDDTKVVGSHWSPAVDIKEEDDRFVLHADIPGVRPEDIEITLEKGVLAIKGERKHETQESTAGYHRVERSHGSFMRRFALPEGVDPSGVSAASKDGVLEIVIPKAARAEARKIEVRG